MLRILVVDDERGIRNLLTAAFDKAGYAVRTAADAEEAMNLLASDAFDVVLSDVLMPSQSGHDLVRWVAERFPATQCVLMTAADIPCDQCPYNSRCKVLPKPFSPKDAVAFVEQILREPLR